jgi:predicted component of type VI protein secretion system
MSTHYAIHHRRLELRRGITAARRDKEERIRYERAKWKVRSTRTKIIRRTATATAAAATATAASTTSALSKLQQTQPQAVEQSKLQLQLQGSPLVRPEHATLSPVKRSRLMQLSANSNTSSGTTADPSSTATGAAVTSSKTELLPALRDTYDAVVAATADVLRAGTFNYRQDVAQQDFRETGYMCHDCGKPMFSKHGCGCTAQHS